MKGAQGQRIQGNRSRDKGLGGINLFRTFEGKRMSSTTGVSLAGAQNLVVSPKKFDEMPQKLTASIQSDLS